MSWRSLAKDLLDKQEAFPKTQSIPKTPVDAIPIDSFGDYGDFGDFGEGVACADGAGVGLPQAFAIPDDEREAIMLVGEMPSTWAKVFSQFEADRPPQGLSARHWQDRLDAILVFADRYARDLDGLGWNAEALFAIGEHWQRLDLRGLGWFIAEDLAAGGVVVEVGAGAIVYQTNRGAQRTIKNEAVA
jgi:hypothetical protein